MSDTYHHIGRTSRRIKTPAVLTSLHVGCPVRHMLVAYRVTEPVWKRERAKAKREINVALCEE